MRCSNWQRRISYREIISGEQYIYEHPSIPTVILQNIFCAFLRAFEIVVSKLIIHRLDLPKKCVFLIKRIKRVSWSRDSLIDRRLRISPKPFHRSFKSISSVDGSILDYPVSFRWLFPSLFENRSDLIRILTKKKTSRAFVENPKIFKCVRWSISGGKFSIFAPFFFFFF